MVAYVEAAERVRYPVHLLNLTRPEAVVAALCALSPPAVRRCLRKRALRGAALSSPQFSANELIVGLCSVAKDCAPGGML